jgi:hypothetical protein
MVRPVPSNVIYKHSVSTGSEHETLIWNYDPVWKQAQRYFQKSPTSSWCCLFVSVRRKRETCHKNVLDFRLWSFWVVTPCSFVSGYQRFRGTCCLHLQGTTVETSDVIFSYLSSSSTNQHDLSSCCFIFRSHLSFLSIPLQCILHVTSLNFISIDRRIKGNYFLLSQLIYEIE